MLRFENVATPLVAVTVRVPERVPPLGFVPRATVIVPLKLVSVVPAPSWAATFTGGAIELAAAVLLCWAANATRVAGDRGAGGGGGGGGRGRSRGGIQRREGRQHRRAP